MNVTTIFGPPGTGKTTRLVQFAKDEERGLFLSYTRAAAAEAVSRLHGNAIRPSTMHSLAFNALGLSRASVVDADKMKLFGQATGIPFKGMDGCDDEQEGDEYRDCLSFSRNMMYIENDTPWNHFGRPGTRERWIQFISEYESWKQTYGYMDFDDMLSLYTRQCEGKVPVVFLDEAQDCTPLQWNVFHKVIKNATRVFIAGDDDQAIYEWNGADPHGMISVTNHYQGDIVVLDESHRLPVHVHKLALDVIGTIEHRVEKKFRPAARDGIVSKYRDLEMVVDKLTELAPKGALILVRDGFTLAEVKRTLNRWMVPYGCYGVTSPWTSKIANAIRAGDLTKESTEIPIAWRSFYKQADLTAPIKYWLSTIHSAKGREHETVIMDLDCPARVLLNISRDRDAETRVQYVGMTRAKNHLILCGQNPIVT